MARAVAAMGEAMVVAVTAEERVERVMKVAKVEMEGKAAWMAARAVCARSTRSLPCSLH